MSRSKRNQEPSLNELYQSLLGASIDYGAEIGIKGLVGRIGFQDFLSAYSNSPELIEELAVEGYFSVIMENSNSTSVLVRDVNESKEEFSQRFKGTLVNVEKIKENPTLQAKFCYQSLLGDIGNTYNDVNLFKRIPLQLSDVNVYFRSLEDIGLTYNSNMEKSILKEWEGLGLVKALAGIVEGKAGYLIRAPKETDKDFRHRIKKFKYESREKQMEEVIEILLKQNPEFKAAFQRRAIAYQRVQKANDEWNKTEEELRPIEQKVRAEIRQELKKTFENDGVMGF